MRILVFAIATFAALPLAAATRYTVDVETTGDPLSRPRQRSIVIVDGLRSRTEIEQPEPPFTNDVAISEDGGKTVIALNTQLKTWFRAPNGGIPALSMFAAMPRGDRTIRDVKVTSSEEPSEDVGGYPARKYVVRVSYGVREGRGAMRVDISYGATMIVFTTDALDLHRAVGFKTGVPEVDAQLEPAFAKINGFPLKSTISATRMYAGGRPQAMTITATVSDIRTVDAPPHAFERPAGYVYQEPIIGAPGRN
jgi:hypothetical protein